TEEVRQKLEGFLQETSEKGSGDDITLGMIKRLETDDRDYLTDRVEDLDRKVILVEESNMRQQENISVFESKVNDLKQQQYTIQKAVYWGFIWGFSLIMGTFLISNAFSSYLFFRLNKVEKMLNELKEPKSGGKGRSQPLNSSSNTSSPPPETTPSQVPTPIPP
ncbi:MAG: protein phosphatase 2C domain-containing protein, partial [Microcystis aeruginosa]